MVEPFVVYRSSACAGAAATATPPMALNKTGNLRITQLLPRKSRTPIAIASVIRAVLPQENARVKEIPTLVLGVFVALTQSFLNRRRRPGQCPRRLHRGVARDPPVIRPLLRRRLRCPQPYDQFRGCNVP